MPALSSKTWATCRTGVVPTPLLTDRGMMVLVVPKSHRGLQSFENLVRSRIASRTRSLEDSDGLSSGNILILALQVNIFLTRM